MREDTMNTVTLNEALLATVAGEVVIYNYDSKTRRYAVPQYSSPISHHPIYHMALTGR